jgi:hypothetical protein
LSIGGGVTSSKTEIMFRHFLIVVALLLPLPALAQRRPLAAGARVRVVAPEAFSGRATGTIMRLDDDSALVAIPDWGVRPDLPDAVRYYWIDPSATSIEVSRGRSRWRASRRGALVGLTGGALTTIGFAISEGSGTGGNDAGYVLFVGSLYTVSTAVIGGLLGSLFTVERWSRVR